MNRDYEYIVLGLGGFGSAAAYWLARRAGAGVLGLEQFELGHVRGESQDHSRIIRLSYHEPHYVELAKRAYRAWAEVERDAGEQLVLKTGGLDLGPRESAIPLDHYSDSMDAAGVPYERLDAREIMRRWPQWRLDDDIHGLYQAEGGIAMAARGNAAHQRLARAHGATLLDRTPVDGIRPLDGEIEVLGRRPGLPVPPSGDRGRPRGATRRWRRSASISRSGSPRSRSPTSPRPDRTISGPSGSPSGSGWTTPATTASQSSASRDPRSGRTRAGRRPVRPPGPSSGTTRRSNGSSGSSSTGFRRRWVRCSTPRTCLYTLTPDRDFVLDTLPERRDVAVAIGGGHGYKFASVIGRILADLAVDGRSEHDLTPFRIDRAILQLADPPRTYMV